MENFPDELLEKIINFLSKKDAKNVSLCSRRLYRVALRRIWSAPRFTSNRTKAQILHLPIQVLHTKDFSRISIDVLQISTLKLLYLDGYNSVKVSDLHKLEGVQHKIIIHSSALSERIENYVPAMNNLKCSLITDGPLLDFEQLKQIQNIEIELLDMNRIAFHDNDPKEFMHLLMNMRPTKLFFTDLSYGRDRPQFSIHDLEVIIKNDIRLIELSSLFLSESAMNNPLLWDVISKMKYLTSFYMTGGVKFTLRQLEKFGVECISNRRNTKRTMEYIQCTVLYLWLEDGLIEAEAEAGVELVDCLDTILTVRSTIHLMRNYDYYPGSKFTLTEPIRVQSGLKWLERLERLGLTRKGAC